MTSNTQTGTSQKHILLIEDDAGIAQPLTYTLERHGWQVTWLATGLPALEVLNSTSVDFVILDVGLPDVSGFELCKQIRSTTSIPLLFLTAHNDEVDRILGLEIGADDYCAKPFSPREIVSRIKAIWRRSETSANTPEHKPMTAIGAADLSWDVWQFDSKTCTLKVAGKPLDVSKSELQLMLALLSNPTQVFSREQLLAHMSEHPEHRLPRTVDSHIKSIRQKLSKVSDSLVHADAIQTHRGIGYSLVPLV